MNKTERLKHLEKARASRDYSRKPPTGDERKQVQASEPIDPDKAYNLSLVPSLLGISGRALNKAIIEGLPTKRIGAKEFVLGEWLIGHFFK